MLMKGWGGWELVGWEVGLGRVRVRRLVWFGSGRVGWFGLGKG